LEAIVEAYPQVNRGNLLENIHQMFPQATSIDLGSDGEYTTEIPPTIGQLVDLERISFSGDKITGNVPFQLRDLRKLKVLSLQNTRLEDFEAGFSFANLQELETLVIEEPTMDLNPKHILEALSQPGHHPALSTISLHCDHLEDQHIPETIGNLQQLTCLKLDDCFFEGSIPESLFTLHNLEQLRIVQSNFQGSALSESVGNLQRLKVLNLDTCNFLGPFPASICQLRLLENLTLDMNDFQGGALPEEIGNLHNLTTLSARASNLSGPIPQSICRLTNLKHIDLTANEMTGSIPDRLGDLTQLEHLNLGMNHFTGSLPDSFENLTKLKVLVISNNNLTDGGRYLSNLFYSNLKRLQIVQTPAAEMGGNFSANAIEAIRSDGRFEMYCHGVVVDVQLLPITYFDAVSSYWIAFQLFKEEELPPEKRAEILTWTQHRGGILDDGVLTCFEICQRISVFYFPGDLK
jgi:Leucine-rich repeat (LRR) protein